MVEEYDYLFKTIVVGDGGVGKTALTIRFSKDFFTEDYKMTIGVDFHVKTIEINSNEGPLRCKLQIWDTGGQERFSSIRPMYYRGSLGAVILFDLTNYESFEHLPMWIEEIRDNIKNEVPLLLVGNKRDLIDQRSVSTEEISEFTKNFNLYYMETSAKTGDGVGDCFSILACLMIGEDVPDKLLSSGNVFKPGMVSIGTSSAVVAETIAPPEPEIDYIAPPVPEPIPELMKIPEPLQEPAVKESLSAIPSFEPAPEIDFAAPAVPEPVIKTTKVPVPSFEPEPEIDFTAPAVPEPVKEGSQNIPITGSTISSTYKPDSVPFSVNAPVPVPAPEGFQVSVETQSAESFSTKSEKAASLFNLNPPTSDSDSLIDYMPETILSKKEKKEIDKRKKIEEKEEKERITREAKEQKTKEAREAKEQKAKEAREAKEQKAKEAREAKEQKAKEAREAKEKKERKTQGVQEEKERKIREAKGEKERKIREAKGEKERIAREAKGEKERIAREAKGEKERKIRKAQEEKDAREAAKLEKKKKAQEEKEVKKAKKAEPSISVQDQIDRSPTIIQPRQPDLFQTKTPTTSKLGDSSLFSALQSKTKKTEEKKAPIFSPFTATSESEATKSSFTVIPRFDDLESSASITTPLPPVPKKKTKRKTVICNLCGTVLSSDYAFCNKCGAPL